MKLSDFDYDLPPELIAQHPPAERGASRLLHLDGNSGALADRSFRDLPALVSAGCTVNIVGPKGKRSVPVEKFNAGPGKTSLKPGEIVVSLTLPARPKKASDAYLRLIPRTEMDIAVVGVAVGANALRMGHPCR